MGPGFGSFVLVLFLLGHALAHVSGQVASANRTLPTTSSKTDQDITIPLGFAQKSFPDAMIDAPYQSSVQAIGGSGLYELSVTGDLPPGLSMETGGSTVAFGGVPSTAGTYAFQVIIRDANGTSFKQDFSIQVYPRVPGPLAQRQGAVVDSEGITVTDVEAVFFPAQVVDNETITLTDKETDLGSVVVVVNENTKLTDTESELDSVLVVDNEVTTLTDSISGLDADEVADNETITTTDTITVAILTVPRISWTTPAPITYGTPLSTIQLDAIGGVAGTLTYTPPAGTVLPAGQQTLSVTLTPNDTTQYAPATDTVTLTVNQATQSITFTSPTSPVTYPVSPVTLSATGGASGNPVTFSVVSGPGTVSGTNGSTLTITNAGTVVLAANQAGNANYSAAPQVPQSIVVNPPAVAILLSPTPGISTVLGSSNVPFQWTPAAGATLYELALGTTATGSTDLYEYKGTATSTTVPALPANGVTVYATLYSQVNGVWHSNAYLYTESGTPVPAVLTSPTPGVATVLGTTNVAFQWTAGTGVTQYQLNLSAVAPGQSELFSYKGSALTATVSALPKNGIPVYATLYSLINGTWQSNNYLYTESGTSPGILKSPTPGLTTILGTTDVTFQWTTGAGVAEYQLNLSAIGTGGSDLFLYKGTATSAVAPTLPANGATVYATLYSNINGAWQSNAYQYTESGTPTPATLQSPTPGLTTILGTTSVTFKWNAGIDVSDYQLNLSAIAAGESDLYSYKGTALTTTVPNLPANGVTVYATLYSDIKGTWQKSSYVYTESGSPTPAILTSPTPGISTILGTTNVLFQWSAGTSATLYQLSLSTIAPGDSELFLYKGVALSATAATLPANGVKVYARLYSNIDGVWLYNDYVYTEQ
jgi:hypothetical protein